MTSTAVTAFFAPPNEVDPDRLDESAGEMLSALLSRLDGGKRRTLLPARCAGQTRWYGIAPSDREARLLREELKSWLGSPVSSDQVDVRTSSDPIDQAAVDLALGGVALRVDINRGWQSSARLNVASLLDVWSLTPERGVDEPRPVGRVLRQFYEGVLAGERAVAEAALSELRSRSLLSATNLRFLRVELVSALGTPEELRSDPALEDISLLARPQAVTERVADAANQLFVADRLAKGRADWPEAARELEEQWPGLVTHRQQVTTVATARCHALRALVTTDVAGVTAAELLSDFPADALLIQLAPLPAVTTATAPALGPASATEAYFSGDYWSALDACEGETASRTSASIALASAMNIGDSASAVRALAIADSLSPENLETLLTSAVDRNFYEQLNERTSDSLVPNGWLDWLTGDWADRPDLLVQWLREWPPASDLSPAEGDAIAEQLLESLNDARRSRVRNGVAVFVDWLTRDGLAPGAVGLAATIFDVLLGSEPGRTERQAGLVVLEEVLTAGCSGREYEAMVKTIRDQLSALGPRDAGWLAQCLGLLQSFSTPVPDSRASLISDAFGTATAWLTRAEYADLLILNLVFADGELEFTVPAPDADVDGTEGAEREFRVVGIYSLLESAAKVASAWVRKLFPTADVRTSSDHVNGPSLGAFVRSADVLLVQTSHAKHAATQAIEAAATDPDRVVLVHGRGASALVRALVGWVRGETL